MSTNTTTDMPRFMAIIGGYISAMYSPTPPTNASAATDDAARPCVVTSQTIVNALAEMADIELNDVAEIMLYMGYHTGVQSSTVGWVVYPLNAQ